MVNDDLKLGVNLVLATSNSALNLPIFAGYTTSHRLQHADIKQYKYRYRNDARGLKIRVSMVRFRPWPPNSTCYDALPASFSFLV